MKAVNNGGHGTLTFRRQISRWSSSIEKYFRAPSPPDRSSAIITGKSYVLIWLEIEFIWFGSSFGLAMRFWLFAPQTKNTFHFLVMTGFDLIVLHREVSWIWLFWFLMVLCFPTENMLNNFENMNQQQMIIKLCLVLQLKIRFEVGEWA